MAITYDQAGVLYDSAGYTYEGAAPFPAVEARIAWRPEQFNKVTNPGFETDTAGWSVLAGINGPANSITRVTSDFRSGTASGELSCPAAADRGVNFDFGTQTFFSAATYATAYRFVVWLKSVSGTTQATLIIGSEGTSSDRRERDISLTTQWQPFYIDWLPTANRTDVQLAIVNTVAVAMTARIDDVAVYIRDAHTQVENGYFSTDTTGWSVAAGINAAATSITRITSDGFLNSMSGELVTTATTGSGVNFDLGTTKFTQGRTYRAKVWLKSVSGSTSARIRLGSLGTATDRGGSSVTLTTSFAAYTVDWTVQADRTDAEVAITTFDAVAMTVRIGGLEVYEALDDISADADARSTGVHGDAALTYGRGASFDGSSNAAGFASLRVVNDDGKYTPENASGVLYGALEAGKRILIRAVYSGTPYGLFYGQVNRLNPYPMTHTVELQCVDPLDEMARMSIHLAETAGSFQAARRNAYAAAYITDGNDYREPGRAIENSYAYTGTDERGLLDYLDDLNAATGTIHFIQPMYDPALGWRIFSRDRTVHSDATTPSETWNDDLSDLEGYDVTREALVNRQRVDVTAWSPTSFENLVRAAVPEKHSLIDNPDGGFYFLIDDVSGTVPPEVLPITIPANERRVFRFKFSTRIASFDADVDYASGAAVEGTGFAEDKSSTELIVTLETRTSAEIIEKFYVFGTPLIESSLNDSDRKDEESIWTRGERQGSPISSPYIQHPAHANGLADWHIWRRKAPRARPTARRENLFASQLSREVSDRVTLNFARLSISGKVFVIRSFTTTVSDNARRWSSTYEIEELPAAPANGWFKLGTSALDGTAVLAY